MNAEIHLYLPNMISESFGEPETSLIRPRNIHGRGSVYEPDLVSLCVDTEPNAPRLILVEDVVYEPEPSSYLTSTSLIYHRRMWSQLLIDRVFTWLEACIYDSLLLPRHFHARLKRRVIHPYRAWRELESLMPDHTPTSSQIVTRGNHWPSLVSLIKWVLQLQKCAKKVLQYNI